MAFFNSSCSDQGCIDADDFGEYESQTIEVSANSAQSNCTYDPTKELNDVAQGISLREGCFLRGTPSITLEDGTSPSPDVLDSGCYGFQNELQARNLCISYCIQQCLADQGSGSNSAEPSWESTTKKVAGRNSGVTIRANSEISIRAIGNISLGNSAEYPSIFVQAANHLPHSKNSNWQDSFFDVRSNQTILFNFSGEFNDGHGKIGSGAAAIGKDSFNGSRKLIGYVIDHPQGYNFDYSKTNEKEGTDGVPLLPDPTVWTCSYDGAFDMKEAICGNRDTGYTGMGYTNANNDRINEVFPISSEFEKIELSQYGGMIRWNGDGLESEDFDPAAAVTCDGNSGVCNNTHLLGDKGEIVGNLDGATRPFGENETGKAYRVSFKSLTGDALCNTNLDIEVTDHDDNLIRSFTVAVSNAGYSSENIVIESSYDGDSVSRRGQKFRILPNAKSYNDNPSAANCGRAIIAKYSYFRDIKINKSGFVKFTMLGEAGSCDLKGRIINKVAGVHVTTGTPLASADFYEYDDFTVSPSSDPFNILSVPTSNGSLMNWSPEVFVRKGQFIRLAPSSWNGTWSADVGGINRQCGIGMAMYITPRPAVLCGTKLTDVIDNPDCPTKDFNGGSLTGCSAGAVSCSDETSGSYCPLASCQPAITCTTDGTADLFQKSGCSAGDIDKSTCTLPDGASFNHASCTACGSDKLANAVKPAKIMEDNIYKCYDLENYLGKTSNLIATTKAQFDSFIANPEKAKGALELATFNGRYGNFDGFIDSGEVGPLSNKILTLRTPVTFSSSGRLRFFIADGSDFNGSEGAISAYSDNTSPGSNYSGVNGFRVDPSGGLEFSNGQWLEARLCKETDDTTYICKGLNPVHLDGTPKILEIEPPSPTTPVGSLPNLTSPYMINDYGSLVRVAGPGSDDCTDGVTTFAGASYYCHAHDVEADEGLLRLTFKIYDPEKGNCTIPGSLAGIVNNGIRTLNPYYDSSVASNDGQTCGLNEIPSDPDGFDSSGDRTPCAKQFYCANKYSNNSGKYYVNVRVRNVADGNVSNIIEGVVNPVVEAMDGPKDGSELGQAERVYRLLISDPRYKAILGMCVTLMFVFYGVGYLMGVSELSHSEIINRVIKIGLIYMFVGEQGWYWFDKLVVKFFKDGTDYLAFMMASSFDSSAEISQAIANSDYYDKSVLFSSVDKVFGMFFSGAVQKKISALLFASIFGWAYLIIIYNSFLLYVYAVANAVLLYLTAQVFISILFTLGPIFFIFTLFKQTKEMFDKWLSQLIGFSLQQIFLLTTLAFFNMLMYEVIKMSLGYKICWDDVWIINIAITRITLLSFWTIASLPPRTSSQSDVGNIGNAEGIPSLFSILFIWVIASLMNKFITFMTDIAASMGGGLSASAMGKGIADAARAAKKGAAHYAEKGWNKTGGKVVQRIDQKLFDSGKLAKEARKKRKMQNNADRKMRSALSDAGNDAMSNYKKANAHALAGKSKEEQRKLLQEAKDKGMKKKAEELGISETDLKRLKSSKGLKYEGDNLFGAGLQALRQASSSGGALRKSLNEKKVSTKFSHDEAQEAMSKMTEDERKEFIDSAAEGKVKVDRNKKDTLKNAPKSIAKSIGKKFSKAGKSLKETAKSVSWKHESEYDEAERQLVEEGAIDKMTRGFKWSRSDDQKKQIRERQKENAKARKPDTKVGTSADALTQLKREDEYLTEKKNIDDSNMGIVERAAAQTAAYARRSAPNIGNKKADMRHQESKEQLKKGKEAKLSKEQQKVSDKIDKARDMSDAAHAELASTESAMKAHEESVGISRPQDAIKRSFAERHFKGSAAERKTKKAEHKKFKELQKSLNSLRNNDEEYAKLHTAHKRATIVARDKDRNLGIDSKGNLFGNLADRKSKVDQEIARSSENKGTEIPGISDSHKAVRQDLSDRLEKNATEQSDLRAKRDTKAASIREKESRERDLDRAAGSSVRVTRRSPEQKQALKDRDALRKEIKNDKEDLKATDTELKGKHEERQEMLDTAEKMDRLGSKISGLNEAVKESKPDSFEHKAYAEAQKEYQSAQSEEDFKKLFKEGFK